MITDLLKSGSPQFRYLSQEEVIALLDACRESDNRQLNPIVAVVLNSGMRLGEITALEWKGVDFKRGILRVNNKEDHHTKNYRVRVIPLNEFLEGFFARYPIGWIHPWCSTGRTAPSSAK